MRHATIFGFIALLLLGLGGAVALAVIGSQREDHAVAADDFSGSGVEGYALTGTLGGPLTPTTPVDVAVDAAGRIYVADIGLNRVLAFTANGQLDPSWGAGGMSSRLAFPSGLALGPDGALYVLQLGNAEVHVLEPDGTERAFWSVGTNQELGGGVPVALAVDDQGTVYIPDQRAQQIRRFTSGGDALEGWSFPLDALDADQLWPRDVIFLDGQLVLSYSDPAGRNGGLVAFDATGNATSLPAPLEEPGERAPASLALDPDNNLTALYLSSADDAAPLIGAADGAGWEPEGIATLTPINGLFVSGIAYDASDRLLVADPGRQRVRIYSAGGSVVDDIQTPGDQGLLAGIDEIVVGPDGLLYVADPLLGRVVAYRPDGGVQTTFQLPDDPDAPLTTGFTRQRMRIAVDGPGSVYVVDEFTGRITKFRQDGEVISTDLADSDDPERPVVALMVAAGQGEQLYMVELEAQDRVRVLSGSGEDLGVLVEPSWEGAIQDVVVAGDRLYTVELGPGTSPVRSFSAAGDYLDELVDLSRGDGNDNRTGFALAVEPDGGLLIAAVNVDSGPDFEYQLLRLSPDGALRRIGTLPTPLTTQPDIAISPTGVLYIADPNAQQIYVYEWEP